MAISLDESTNPDMKKRELELCQFMQEEELEVLQSIFPEYVHKQNADGIIKFEIPIEFGSSRIVNVIHPNDAPCSSLQAVQTERISVTVLPPVILHLSLPPSYPLSAPPKISSLQVTHRWLEDVGSVEYLLLKIYESGEQTLYNWIEYIRSGDFLAQKNIQTSEEELELSHTSPDFLASTLLRYDESYNVVRFSQNSYACSICLTHLRGTNCLQLQCKHVFCRGCLGDYWKMCIEEGDVGRVGCPDPDCVKEGKESCEDEVARIASPSELERWKWLRTKRDLERDPTILYCPRSQCQNLVPKPKDVDPESGWARFRQCSRCQFSFCSFCSYTWHGPISSCPIAYKQRLIQEYLATDEGSAERTVLELRYGRALVLRIMAQHEEDLANQEWISSSSTPCPGCTSPVQKSEGCNHMTCTRCTKHFCYRCGDELDALHPYDHFSLDGSYCYQKLFDWEGDANLFD